MYGSTAKLPFREILLPVGIRSNSGGEPGDGPGPVQCTTPAALLCKNKANSIGPPGLNYLPRSRLCVKELVWHGLGAEGAKFYSFWEGFSLASSLETSAPKPQNPSLQAISTEPLSGSESPWWRCGCRLPVATPNNLLVVVVGVVGDNQHTIILAQVFKRRALHLQIVFSSLADQREVGIVIADVGALFLQKLNDGQRRRFAKVVNIFFVGDA